jgi:hypothetical protein
MPHRRKKQSTGSYATHRDQHEGQQKQKKEKKKRDPNWHRKNETDAQRKQRKKSLIHAFLGID